MAVSMKIDSEKLTRAIQKFPQEVKDATDIFLVRASSFYKSSIVQSPWRLSSAGGGSPLDSGNLKKSHEYKIEPFKLVISVNERKSPYASFVHDGTYKMQERPWLDYAVKTQENKINSEAKELLQRVTDELGS